MATQRTNKRRRTVRLRPGERATISVSDGRSNVAVEVRAEDPRCRGQQRGRRDCDAGLMLAAMYVLELAGQQHATNETRRVWGMVDRLVREHIERGVNHV